MKFEVSGMNYISGEMEWLKTRMQAHDHPASELVHFMPELVHFMQSYAKAMDRHINGSGCPIIDWLSLESAKPAF